MTPQEQVVNAVKARGYWAGYTAYQMLSRNIVKMIEELAEAGESLYLDHTGNDGELDSDLLLLGEAARKRFDQRSPDDWLADPLLGDWFDGKLAKELADMQVVLFNAAQAFAELRGQPFDVVAAAVEKATADVARGVRKEQP